MMTLLILWALQQISDNLTTTAYDLVLVTRQLVARRMIITMNLLFRPYSH